MAFCPDSRTRPRVLLLIGLLGGAAAATAHDAADVAEPAGATAAAGSEVADVSRAAEHERISEAFGWDFDTAEVTTRRINDSLHVLFGVGGNVLVSTGSDGVLMVDDQFPEMAPRLLDAIETLGHGGVDFVVNTHWHFDHADGNLTFGPGGAWLVSHASSREMMRETRVIDMVGIEYTQLPYPPESLPVITFERAMQFHFNGERVDLLHFGPAHTTGDTAVIFTGSNVAHLGDVYNNAGYPFIDVGNGGDLEGVIAFCQAVLERLDEQSVVVPGHGPVADYRSLQGYVQMLQVVRDRIAELVGEGADLEAVMAAEPTRGFDEQYGDPARFIDRAYFSLAGAGRGSED